MHLISYSEEELKNLSKYFKSEQIEYIAPCHCCDLKSKIILSKDSEIQEICTGDIISLN